MKYSGIHARSELALLTEEPPAASLMDTAGGSTERAGVELSQFAKLLKELYLQQKSREYLDLATLRSLLIAHGFLLSCDAD